MNDDLDTLESLWNVQQDSDVLDISKVKKMAVGHRLRIVAAQIFEVGILLLCGYMLWFAFDNNWSLVNKAWIAFGLVAGLCFAIPASHSRFLSLQTLSVSTSDRFAMELELSRQALKRVALTNAFIGAFCVALLSLLMIEFIWYKMALGSVMYQAVFGLVWLAFLAWINHLIKTKHQRFISTAMSFDIADI